MKLPLLLLAAGSLAAVVLWSLALAVVAILVAGTLRTVAALTADPLTIRSQR